MIPTSGPITSAQLRAELGLAAGAAFSMSDARIRRLSGKAAGTTQKASDLRGAHLARAVSTNVNAFTAMGSPAAVATYRFVVEPGVTLGSITPAVASLSAGAFPAGSTVNIDVYGIVDAAGGQATINGGVGGMAINGDYGGYTLNVSIKPGGTAEAGGGAGGQGGAGGTGGPGTTTVVEGPVYNPGTYEVNWVNPNTGEDPFFARYYWNGVLQAQQDVGSGTPPPAVGLDGATYSAGALQSSAGFQRHYAITRTSTGSGGVPGSGGAGGEGGRGQGYDGAAASGQVGQAGGAGTSGAGNGGQGGQGGTGGARGNSGSQGGTGSPGGAGTSGAGTPGSNGSPGAQAGYYFYKNGRGNVTFTNAGTVIGRLG